MNEQQPTFGVKFEGNQLPIPKELQNVPKLDLKEITFISFDYYPSFTSEDGLWVDALVTESGEVYKQETKLDYEFSEKGVNKTEGASRLTKIEDFTGQICFGSFIAADFKEEGEKEGKDFSVSYKATFVKGKLDSVETLKVSSMDSGNRVNLMDEINKSVMRQVKIMNNPLYRWVYVPYKWILVILTSLVSYVWMLPLRILLFLVKLITPI